MRRLLTIGVVVAFAMACGTVVTIPSEPDDGLDGSANGTLDGASRGDGAINGGDASNDAPDGEPPDLPCTTTPEGTAVYVSANGPGGASCGGVKTPCDTIGRGLARAVALGLRVVHVSSGTFVETVDLRPGIRIEGGWDVDSNGRFGRTCPAAPSTIIHAPDTETAAVVARNLGGRAELESLTIEMLPPSSSPGVSLYGLLAVGASSHVVLTNVAIDVGRGGNGRDGLVGASGATPIATCPAGTGADGVAGDNGAGAVGGTFTAAGYAPVKGTDGSIGGLASHGTAGADGSCVQCGVCNEKCAFNEKGPLECGKPGSNGCAGGRGEGGAPGESGGSSFGIYAWGAKVVTLESTVRTRAGGSGGEGGIGGDGANGTVGTTGAAPDACVTNCFTGILDQCTEIRGRGQGGAPGGTGGKGGKGGTGGGGAGGHSIAIFTGGSATVTTTSTTLQHGTAGAPGGPSGVAGAAGMAADRYPN